MDIVSETSDDNSVDIELVNAKTPTGRSKILLKRARIYHRDGRQELAIRDLKEALALAPQDDEIINALRDLYVSSRKDDVEAPGDLLKAFVRGEDSAGKRIAELALNEIFAKEFVTEDNLRHILAAAGMEEPRRDVVGSILLTLSTRSKDIQKEMQRGLFELDDHSKIFSSPMLVGLKGIEAYANLLVQKDIWTSNEKRLNKMLHMITGLINTLDKSNDTNVQIGFLNAIIRIVSDEPELIVDKISGTGYCGVFNMFNAETNSSFKSRIIVLLTLLIGKQEYESESSKTFRSALSKFVKTKLAASSSDDYGVVFSVISLVFSVRSEFSASVFLEHGFLEEAMDAATPTASAVTRISALEMLSAACIEKSCRKRIAEASLDFLEEYTESKVATERALAATIIAKLEASNSMEQSRHRIIAELAQMVKSAQSQRQDTLLKLSIEGLVFASTVPGIKELLANDKSFLFALLATIKSSPDKSNYSLVYGCLSILVNLTKYTPPLTEEQKRINDIRKIARDSTAAESNILDSDIRVSERCKQILNAGALDSLNSINVATPATSLLVAQMFLNLATTVSSRGQIAQQGGVKLLLALLLKEPAPESDILNIASQALAKILVSINPSLIFNGRTPITHPIRPLTLLLSDDNSPTDLPKFESILALTNLASANDSARDTIIELAWPIIEDLLLSENYLLQRGATELVCNLVVSDKGAEKFVPSDKNKPAGNRLHILIAITDVEDLPTRRAAAGAIAMLTDFPEICDAITKMDSGVRSVLRLMEDEAGEEMEFRGVICLRNMVCKDERDTTGIGIKVVTSGGIKIIRTLMERAKNPNIISACRDIIQDLIRKKALAANDRST